MAECRIAGCPQTGNPTPHGPECHIHQAHLAMKALLDGTKPEHQFNSGGTWCLLVDGRRVAAHRALVAYAMGRPLAHGQRERVYRLRKGQLRLRDLLLETVRDDGQREYVAFDENGKRLPTCQVPPPRFKDVVGGKQRRHLRPVNQLDPDTTTTRAAEPEPGPGGLTTEQMARIYLAATEQGQTVQQYLAAQFTA